MQSFTGGEYNILLFIDMTHEISHCDCLPNAIDITSLDSALRLQVFNYL